MKFREAIHDATMIALERDPKVFLIGVGIIDPKAVWGTVAGALKKFGTNRVIEGPLSEDALTGISIGAATMGLRPILIHHRMDFVMLAMNQIVNMAAKTYSMFGGQECVPLVVRSIIGKSWGQGAQHSQGLYPMFMHVPGLKVVAPSTPFDAKGCLAAAVRDDNPVMFVEHRILYYQNGFVPEGEVLVPPGKARVSVRGRDVTLVGISYMQVECLRAQRYLEDVNVSAEIIDPIWLSPLDMDTIEASVRRTGRLVVVDNGWVTCGAGAEILASLAERMPDAPGWKAKRMGFAQVPCPTTPSLEEAFYPNARTIAAAAYDMVRGGPQGWLPAERPDLKSIEFKGPF